MFLDLVLENPFICCATFTKYSSLCSVCDNIHDVSWSPKVKSSSQSFLHFSPWKSPCQLAKLKKKCPLLFPHEWWWMSEVPVPQHKHTLYCSLPSFVFYNRQCTNLQNRFWAFHHKSWMNGLAIAFRMVTVKECVSLGKSFITIVFFFKKGV